MIGTGYHGLSIGMISGALANDHYRAARSVPLVRRTAGNGATRSPRRVSAKDRFHPIEPIPAGIANGSCGASSAIRRVVSHRLQSADSGPSHPRPGTGSFNQSCHLGFSARCLIVIKPPSMSSAGATQKGGERKIGSRAQRRTQTGSKDGWLADAPLALTRRSWMADSTHCCEELIPAAVNGRCHGSRRATQH